MSTADSWIDVLRASHDRYAATVGGLAASDVTAPSYDSEWTIADVASHMGSGAEIFALYLDATLTSGDNPTGDMFGPIWDRWNATAPAEQVASSVAIDEQLVARLEGLSDAAREQFALSMFGMDLDLAGFVGMRLGEHAVHHWDVAVALDPATLVAADAVELLIDRVAPLAGRAGKPAASPREIVIATTEPSRRFRLTTGPQVSLAPDTSDDAPDLTMSGETFLRVVYGRLDPDHTPASLRDDSVVAELREIFPGF